LTFILERVLAVSTSRVFEREKGVVIGHFQGQRGWLVGWQRIWDIWGMDAIALDRGFCICLPFSYDRRSSH
jgi:hypothetical protein